MLSGSMSQLQGCKSPGQPPLELTWRCRMLGKFEKIRGHLIGSYRDDTIQLSKLQSSSHEVLMGAKGHGGHFQASIETKTRPALLHLQAVDVGSGLGSRTKDTGPTRREEGSLLSLKLTWNLNGGPIYTYIYTYIHSLPL